MELTSDAHPARSNGRLVAWLVFVGAFAALNYAARFGSEMADDQEEVFYSWAFAVAAAVQFLINLVIVLLIAGGARRDVFAIARPRNWGSVLGIGIGAYVAIVIVAAATAPFGDATEEQGLVPESWDSSRATQFAVNAVFAVAVIPLIEEMTFRGLGYSLLRRFGPAFAVVSSAVLFGLAHGLVLGLPVIVVLGIGLALVRERTGSVVPCVLLHGLFNGSSLALSLTL